MVVEQQHPTAGPIKVINTPMKFSETPAQLGPAAPRLGEHTQEVLEWLWHDAAHIERLRQERVVKNQREQREDAERGDVRRSCGRTGQLSMRNG